MNAIVVDRPQALEIADFLALVASKPTLLAELKAALDDQHFIDIAVRRAIEAGIPLTAELVHSQMMEDRRAVRFMSLEQVEMIADGLLGARMSGGHKSHMPPRC